MHDTTANRGAVPEIREQIYPDAAPGYFVFRRYVPPRDVAHIRSFWLDRPPEERFVDFIRNVDVTRHTPNYRSHGDDERDRVWCCFLWNAPVDQITHEIAYRVQLLRNSIEGSPLYSGLASHDSRALQYRVCNHASGGTIVHEHADFVEMHRRDPAADHTLDPSRVQATLFLSAAGRDFDGDGMLFTRNDGRLISLQATEDLQPGDLVIWRYSNVHTVRGIDCRPDQPGFMRIIYPTFDLPAASTAGSDMRAIAHLNGRTIFERDSAEESL